VIGLRCLSAYLIGRSRIGEGGMDFEVEFGTYEASILYVLSKRGNKELQFLDRYSVSEGCECTTWR
jgi:hypothetical protein